MNKDSEKKARAGDARTFYRAVYGRMQHRDGAFLPVWRGQNARTLWLDATDEAAYVDTVSTQTGGHVYTPVRLRARKVTGKPSAYGGAGDLVEHVEAIFVDWDVASNGKADGSDGGLGYAPDKDSLRGLIASFTTETGMPAHAIVETPSGFHTWHLTEPLTTAEAADMHARFQGKLAMWLADRGYQVDSGVTVTPTRVGRAPGAYHVKHLKGEDSETEPWLVRLASVDDAPAISKDTLAALPRVLPVKISLPLVDRDLVTVRDAFSLAVPVSEILPLLGWVHSAGQSWSGPVAGGSADAGHLLTADSGAEVLVVWSERNAEALGVAPSSAVGSFDLVAKASGSYRAAQRIAERVTSDRTDASKAALIALFEAGADEGEFAALASRADAGWPDELDRRAQGRLAFRGVDPDVATARGYRTDDAFTHPGHDVHWALEMPVHLLNGQTGSTVQARVVEKPQVDKDGKAKRGPGRPRKDADEEPLPETIGVNNTPLRGLACNPLVADAVGDADLPLVIVTQDEPGQAVDRYVPVRYAQVQADAVLSAARRERVDVAVAHAPTWASLIFAAGEGDLGAREDRLHPTFGYVPLQGRAVHLASRSTWRRDRGLAQIVRLLEARGADVQVLDVPRLDRVRPAEVTLDWSTWGVDDHLAANAAHDPLRRLIEKALPADEALFQARVPDETATAEMADLVVEHLLRSKQFLYDSVSKRWAVDRGSHLQVGGAGASPHYFVRRILSDHDVVVQSVKVLQDIVRGVEQDARIQIATTDLDRDGRELPALGGLVDLHTAKLRPRPTGHLNSKVCPVVYDPDAVCPHWDRFLLDSMKGDEELVNYLQMVAGATLIGEIIEEEMYFFYGPGRNGKSTFTNILAAALGPYARALPVEMLSSKPTPFQVGDLRGLRLVLLPEAPRGMRMADGALKTLVTRDPLTGERKFGDSFSFNLSLTAISAVNHLPTVLSRDDGTWRRIRVVRWENQISDADADRGLEPRLRAELPGILAWAVRGAQKVLANVRASEEGGRLEGGLLGVPEAVQKATQDHKDNTDLLRAWMDEACTAGKSPGGGQREVSQAEVHTEFRAWLEEQDERKWAPASIREALAEKGYPARRDAKGRYYVGFDLTPPAEDETPAQEDAGDAGTPAEAEAEAEDSADVAPSNVRELPPAVSARTPSLRVVGNTALAEDEEEL